MKSGSIFDSRLIICLGSGGVGKTTISAALALAGSRLNLRTLVLTVDPARRLADALGIKDALGKPTPIPGQPNAFAMMFDIERGWQELLSRELGQHYFNLKLRNNRFFQHLVSDLPGSHEFIACDKVYELVVGSYFDLVILDTPPSSQGMQFLDAPQRLVKFFENELFLSILRSKNFLGRVTFGFLDRTTNLLNRVLKYFAESSFTNEMFDFIYLLRDLYPIMASRSHDFQDMLSAKSTQFVIVSRPLNGPLLEASELTRNITTKNYHLETLILNQVSPLFSEKKSTEGTTYRILELELERANVERTLWEKIHRQMDLPPHNLPIPRTLSHDQPLERIAQIAQKLQCGLYENTGFGH